MTTTTQTLSARLNTVSESNKSILQLITRLSKLDFQPGSVPLNNDEGDVRLELSAEIHESLKQVEEELELLRQEIEEITAFAGSHTRHRDSEKDRERSRLAISLTRLTEDVKSSRSQFRKAQLQAKRNSERAKQKERDLLFANIQSGTNTPTSLHRRNPQKEVTADELLVNASSDVTSALRRTHQLMQSEVSRSRFAQETLENSTKALEDLSERYTDLNSLLANSRNLLGTLLRSQKSDTWYLETAFYILITTIIWLVFRRWLYGPLWWFIWLPIKLGYKLLFSIFAAVGLTGSATTTSVSVAQHSTSLIIKPSATGGPPKINRMSGQQPYIRAGGGGAGAKQDPSAEGSMSQQVGQQAEQAASQQNQEEQVVRGDGTVLEKRTDQPRNPKKKMWDEGVESAKHEQQQQTHSHRKRDEL